MPSSNLSMFSVISPISSFNLFKIQRSAGFRWNRSGVCRSFPSMFIMMNREAFHTLLAKFRLASTFSQ